MRIGTWNVEYAEGKSKNERRLRRLAEMNCDVWVLTETHDELDLGTGYRATSTSRREGKRPGSRWTTIWSRYPVVNAVRVKDEHRTVAAIMATPLGQLLVFGTVLPWHSDRGPTGTAPNWTEHHRVVSEQCAEWAVLREAYPAVAMCVAGDFNASLGDTHYYGTKRGREMLIAGLATAGLACVTVDVPSGLLDHAPIDHIAVSRELAVDAGVVAAWEGKDADGCRLSDHSGLVVAIDRLRSSSP